MTDTAHTLTIITINLDNAAGLKRTVESVVEQSARGAFEYIVVDGGSTDGSVELLEEYAGKIDRYISEPDSGRYAAMNKSVRLAGGNYLLFLNSGDTLVSADVIERVIGELDGRADIISGDTVTVDCRLQAARELSAMMLVVASLPHPSTFIRRKLLEKHPYDESMAISADWRFFFERAVEGGVSYKRLDRVVSRFDTGGISMTDPVTAEAERRKVLAEYMPSALSDRIISEYGFDEITFCSRFGQSSLPRRLTRLFMRLMYKFFGKP